MGNQKKIPLPAALTLALLICHAHGQGPLAPPAAPAESMKSLDQIEPRTPISSLPFVIDEPGSYYLTSNLESTGNGIVIQTDHITVDLMGFRITGNGAGSSRGILLDKPTLATIRNVVVKNGHVSRFGIGLRAQLAQGARFHDLTLASNVTHGVEFFYGNGNRLERSVIQDNGEHGIYLYAFANPCSNHIIADTAILNNGEHGVFTYALAGEVSGIRLQRCNISGNGGNGIYWNAEGGRVVANSVVESEISRNDLRGIWIRAVSGGISDSHTFRRLSVNNNGAGIGLLGDGSCSGNSFSDITLTDNTSYGVELIGNATGNRFDRLQVLRNGVSGFRLESEGQACDGNALRHSHISGHSQGVVLLANGGRCDGNLFAFNTIVDNNGSGLYLYGRSDGQVNGNMFHDNTIASPADHVLFLRAQANGRVNGNRFERNTVRDGVKSLLLAEAEGVIRGNAIENNIFEGWSNTGISVEAYGSGSRAVGNVIAHNVFESDHVSSFTLGVYLRDGDGDGSATEGNRVQANEVATSRAAAAGFGISTLGTRHNLFVQNVVTLFDFFAVNLPSFFGTENMYGPQIVPHSQMNDTSHAHPWANLVPQQDPNP